MTDRSSTPAQAAIDVLGDDLFQDLVGWRRVLHSHPELGFAEHQTAAYIRNLLTIWEVPFECITSTGTIASLRGDTDGPVLMIRADIDALPVPEETGLPFAASNGHMHACGHDGHTAIVLGLVKYLADRKHEITGEVRFLFQPAEETAEGGAPVVIGAGGLEGVDAVAGLHLLSTLPTGHIGLTEGPLLGAEDRFDVTITGRGGHTSGPHETVDALVIAAGLVGQLQTLISRRVDPLVAATLSVGTLHSGDAYNVIAGSATLSGTVRTLSPEARDTIERELVALAKGFAQSHGADAKVNYFRGNPPVINSVGAVSFAKPAAIDAVGEEGVTSLAPFLGAEDFAYYGEALPTVFVFLGAGKDHTFPLHHPKFDIDEDALAIGLLFFHGLVRRWSDDALSRWSTSR